MLRQYVPLRPELPRACAATRRATQRVAKEFKVYYAEAPGKTRGQLHDGPHRATYVFDPQGRLRLFVRYGSGAGALART